MSVGPVWFVSTSDPPNCKDHCRDRAAADGRVWAQIQVAEEGESMLSIFFGVVFIFIYLFIFLKKRMAYGYQPPALKKLDQYHNARLRSIKF